MIPARAGCDRMASIEARVKRKKHGGVAAPRFCLRTKGEWPSFPDRIRVEPSWVQEHATAHLLNGWICYGRRVALRIGKGLQDVERQGIARDTCNLKGVLVPGERHHRCAHSSGWAEVVGWKEEPQSDKLQQPGEFACSS